MMVFKQSKLSGSPHRFLAQLAGGWAGITNTWLEPESMPIESLTKGSIQSILDGRFVLYLYQSSINEEQVYGLFTFGYNTILNQYEASWLDSFHNNTANIFCMGNSKENGFFVLGSYPDPVGGPDWFWRTEVVLVDHDHLTITAFNISPEGIEAKAVETKLKRIK